MCALDVLRLQADFIAAGFPCIICAHIADGNFHCCIPYQPQAYDTVKAIETRMIRRALQLEGTVAAWGHAPAFRGAIGRIAFARVLFAVVLLRFGHVSNCNGAASRWGSLVCARARACG